MLPDTSALQAKLLEEWQRATAMEWPSYLQQRFFMDDMSAWVRTFAPNAAHSPDVQVCLDSLYFLWKNGAEASFGAAEQLGPKLIEALQRSQRHANEPAPR